MANVAIIGGTGFDTLGADLAAPEDIVTPFGSALVRLLRGSGANAIYFLPRHGADHSVYPHQINYRANIAALQQLGVTRVLATNAVGALRVTYPVGTLLVFSDFIDYTSRRVNTFFANGDNSRCRMHHADLSVPYCEEVRRVITESAAVIGVPVLEKGVYVCVDGPRYESPAEVAMFAAWGGDVVGMTGLPEAVLAREAGLCYAGLGVVTNAAAGLQGCSIAHGAVSRVMREMYAPVYALVTTAAANVPAARSCSCGV